MRVRATLSFVCLAAVGLSDLPRISGQLNNCRDCEPSRYNYAYPSGTYKVGFQAGMFDSTQEARFRKGAAYWNEFFTVLASGVTVSEDPVSYASADIKVYLDPGLIGTGNNALAYLAPDGRGSIAVNPEIYAAVGSNLNYWEWLGAHEVGHQWDFMNVPTGPCSGRTIMYQSIPYGVGALPSWNCSDSAATADKFGYNGLSYCDYGCPAGWTETCVGDQTPNPDYCNCCINYSPIVIDLNDDGFAFGPPVSGPVFQMSSCGAMVRVSWPEKRDDVWLALDLNRNGQIDNGAELFGNTTRLNSGGYAKNGYEALSQWDENGDDWIDAYDSVYRSLVVWSDRNGNGISEVGELRLLPAAGVLRLGLKYRERKREDRWGNKFAFVGRVVTDGGEVKSVDVFLASIPLPRTQ